MADSVAGVVLAAGAGTRLAPLTRLLPKALCPLGDTTLVDRAVDVVGRTLGLAVTPEAVAVNAHHRADLLEAAMAGRVHVSVEAPALLGTAGALGRLRSWIDGRDVVVMNADAVHDADLTAALAGWDHERVRLVVAGPVAQAFGPSLRLCAVLMPAATLAPLGAEPSGLFAAAWTPAAHAGRLEVVGGYEGPWFDCGTPGSYLAANLWTSGGRSVVGAGAVVHGHADACVVWPGSVVHAGENLARTIRAGRLTVMVR